MATMLPEAADQGTSRHGALSASSSRLARCQAALIGLGRENLSSLDSARLEHEIVSLLARTLETELCALVEVIPNKISHRIDRLVCVPPSAAHCGPLPGSLAAADPLLGGALADSSCLLVDDVQTDERYQKTWFHRQGIRSAVIVPMLLHGQPQGLLVMGHADPDFYHAEDLEFLELFASVFSAHIARAKAEEAVRQEREYVAALLDGTSALTITINSRGKVTRANKACLALSGLRKEEIVGEYFWKALCVATEAQLSEASFNQLNATTSAIEFESTLQAPDGKRRYIGWRMCYLLDPRDETPVIVATGVDMTTQRQAELEARQAIVAAEAARRLVDELRALRDREGDPNNPADASPQGRSGRAGVPPRGIDRRTSQRKLFPYRQKIAPYEKGIIPPRASFSQVRCWDISAGGISFLLESPPAYKSLVVVLGTGPSEVLMTAEVTRVAELTEDGSNGYLVGCRFTGKI